MKKNRKNTDADIPVTGADIITESGSNCNGDNSCNSDNNCSNDNNANTCSAEVSDVIENTIVLDARDITSHETADVSDTVVTDPAVPDSGYMTEVRNSNSDIAGRSNTAPGLRIIYALLSILAPVAGTVGLIYAAVTYCMTNMQNIGTYTEAELEDSMEWGVWLAQFSGEHSQVDFINHGIIVTSIAFIIAAASVTGLMVLTGRFRRDADGAVRLNWFDRIWSELHIAVIACAACGAAALGGVIGHLVLHDNHFGFIDMTSVFRPASSGNYSYATEYYYDISNNMAFWYSALGIAVCMIAAMVCSVTLVKKIKARRLFRHSLIGRLLKLLGIGAAAAGHGAARVGRGVTSGFRKRTRTLTVPADTDKNAMIKLTVKYWLIVLVLLAGPEILLLTVLRYQDVIYLIIKIIALLTAIRFVTRKIIKINEIRAGVIEVRSGNLGHRISVEVDAEGPKTDLDKLASDINHISEATSRAVQAEIRNQRMKTDLISNVSHDLKTPLTSMISYLDILEREGLDSPDAPDHLAVVKDKTERLKTLTDELFEAAKASSGNIPCEIGDIDLSALIDQSLAEMGDRLERRQLKVRKKYTADNMMVRADGRLLYRVLENLLGNISKYALEGSRVYINVSDPDVYPGRTVPADSSGNKADPSGSKGISGTASVSGKLLLEVKNISAAELNISADELMERFTRGDESRNTEGSGLGLAIAKDLTTLMGGKFDISIDGDMFKASVLLSRA